MKAKCVYALRVLSTVWTVYFEFCKAKALLESWRINWVGMGVR